MELQLINGEFVSADALDLLTQMIHVKIKYHEKMISRNSNEEDIKYRETKIKHLQKELFLLRNHIGDAKGKVRVDARVNLD